MGPIERAIRSAVTQGERLETPAERVPFLVERIDSEGVVLLLGARGWWTRFSWECLEGIGPYLSERQWVRIATKFATEAEPGSLDAYLKTCVKRATAGWVAALLERAGIVELDRSRPARVRLLPGRERG